MGNYTINNVTVVIPTCWRLKTIKYIKGTELNRLNYGQLNFFPPLNSSSNCLFASYSFKKRYVDVTGKSNVMKSA